MSKVLQYCLKNSMSGKSQRTTTILFVYKLFLIQLSNFHASEDKPRKPLIPVIAVIRNVQSPW
ncbi:hypothetical protein RhiirB3_418244 [Rhizophagus irregularis]|nr:hypothetical protein RhiirB3_418244 [Rhizophagus irregularis]